MTAICVTTVTQMTLSQNDFNAQANSFNIVLSFKPKQALAFLSLSTQNNLTLQFAGNLFKTIRTSKDTDLQFNPSCF